MTNPYRSAAETAVAADERRRDPEVLAIYVVLAVLGAARLIVAVALGEAIGAESTVALGMVLAGLAGLVRR